MSKLMVQVYLVLGFLLLNFSWLAFLMSTQHQAQILDESLLFKVMYVLASMLFAVIISLMVDIIRVHSSKGFGFTLGVFSLLSAIAAIALTILVAGEEYVLTYTLGQFWRAILGVSIFYFVFIVLFGLTLFIFHRRQLKI